MFSTFEGKPAITLYADQIGRLLKESDLKRSSAGSLRSTYCFRHTYATFRLTEGVDVYFLAKQMGTSVQMIEAHYGHINPVNNAERILQGLPGWELIATAPQVVAEAGRVHAETAKVQPSRQRQRTVGLIRSRTEVKENNAASSARRYGGSIRTHAPLALWIGPMS